MQDKKDQLDTKTPQSESYGSTCDSTRVQESPVLSAISAHLNKWYSDKNKLADILEVLEKPPVGLNLPY